MAYKWEETDGIAECLYCTREYCNICIKGNKFKDRYPDDEKNEDFINDIKKNINQLYFDI